MPTAHRVVSSVDCHHVRSNSIVLSGLDDGSPLCATSQSLPIDGSRPITDASFGSGYEGIGRAGSGGFTTTTTPSANTPTSRVDLFSDYTACLPSPMMKLATSAPATPIPSRRRERTPPPTRKIYSQSFSHSQEDNEIIGDMVPDTPATVALFPFARLRCFQVHYTDEEQSSCIATTTGASFGKITAPTPHSATTHSTQSDANGLFSNHRNGGDVLFDSHEDEASSSSARDMVALDVLSLAPTIMHQPPPHDQQQHQPPTPQFPTPSMSVLTQTLQSQSSRVPLLHTSVTHDDESDLSLLIPLGVQYEQQLPTTQAAPTASRGKTDPAVFTSSYVHT